jgi:CubicO group peptidase (beta-lactamase class C family)
MIDKSVLDDIREEKFRSVCAQVVDEMNRLPIPGAVVGVLHGDKETIAAFGTTNIEQSIPVSKDTLFQVGSITKTFVATAVMRLVEMGKLDMGLPVRTYLPDLRLKDEQVAQQVTLRHLLTHTGGWVGDYFDDFGMGADALAKMVAKMADLDQLTPLGEIWSYNNSGFYLAGRVIEVVTGQSFEKAMQELVLDPLGLKMTFFFAEDVMTYRFATGHKVEDKKPVVARPWALPRSAHPAGGIISTVSDLFRYARFHMGDGTAADGTRLLSQESLTQMQIPILPSTGLNMIGLSWSITSVDGTQMIAHGGGTNGQITLLRIVPSRKFAVVVLTNSDEGDLLTYQIADAATKEYLGLVMPEALPLDLPEEKLLSYTGKYEAAADDLEIYLREGELFLQLTPKGGFPTPDSPPTQAPPAVRIAFYDQDRMIALDEPMKDDRGEFLRSAGGQIAWLRLHGRVHRHLA